MTTLYLGTDPSRYSDQTGLIHFPLIRIQPFPLPPDMSHFTHVLITSPNTVHILHAFLHNKSLFSIGKGTTATLHSYNLTVTATASPESQEGMIELLAHIPLTHSYLLYPRSSLARPLLADYLRHRNFPHCTYNLYDTLFTQPPFTPDFSTVTQIIFTSPSTVSAFFHFYGPPPPHIQCTTIGPLTTQKLQSVNAK